MEGLSPRGTARREEMLGELQAAMSRRMTARKRVRAVAGAAVMAGVLVIAAVVVRSGDGVSAGKSDGRPIAAAPRAGEEGTGTKGTRQDTVKWIEISTADVVAGGSILRVVASDPGIVARLSAGSVRTPTAATMDDGELSGVLAKTDGRLALARIGGRAVLIGP